MPDRSYNVSDLPPHIQKRITVDANGCWLVSGFADPDGYKFGRNGKHIRGRMHKVVWLTLVGPLPFGTVLDHHCHNIDLTCLKGKDCLHRSCANPAHLTPSTQQLNAEAMVRRKAVLRGRPLPVHAITEVEKIAPRGYAEVWSRVGDDLAMHGGLS